MFAELCYRSCQPTSNLKLSVKGTLVTFFRLSFVLTHMQVSHVFFREVELLAEATKRFEEVCFSGTDFFSSPEDANSCSKCLKMRHRFCVPKPFGAQKIHVSSSKVNLHFEFGPQTLATRSTHQFSMPTKFQHHPTSLTYFFVGFYRNVF